MQQASATSFFPTAKELSSGVQWFKDHPVLAAAAATAVSVITYLNTLELSETDAERPGDGVDVELAISTRHRRSLSLRRKGSPGVASDSKLSAAVSWCDEHGGSLTQVFEDDTPPCIQLDRSHEDGDTDDEARDGVAESYKNAFQQHKVLTSGLRKSVTQQQLDAVVGAAAHIHDSDVDTAQTESPQWGWYVPITPPQDQFQSTGRDSTLGLEHMARVVVKPMQRSTS